MGHGIVAVTVVPFVVAPIGRLKFESADSNPEEYFAELPIRGALGTQVYVGHAPPGRYRFMGIENVAKSGLATDIAVEPICEFDIRSGEIIDLGALALVPPNWDRFTPLARIASLGASPRAMDLARLGRSTDLRSFSIRHQDCGRPAVLEPGAINLMDLSIDSEGVMAVAASPGRLLTGKAVVGEWRTEQLPTVLPLSSVSALPGGGLVVGGDLGTVMWRANEGAPWIDISLPAMIGAVLYVDRAPDGDWIAVVTRRPPGDEIEASTRQWGVNPASSGFPSTERAIYRRAPDADYWQRFLKLPATFEQTYADRIGDALFVSDGEGKLIEVDLVSWAITTKDAPAELVSATHDGGLTAWDVGLSGRSGFRWSADRGETWHRLETLDRKQAPLTVLGPVLQIDAQRIGAVGRRRVKAGSSTLETAFFVSGDSGKTWSKAASVSAICSEPNTFRVTAGRVYLLCWDGVIAILDEGAGKFTPQTSGFTDAFVR